MSETTEITGPLVKMIRQMGIYALRMNSGMVRVKGGFMHLHDKGTADILVFFKTGRVVWLETKDPKGVTQKQRIADQAAFAEKVRDLGHEYYLIKSIDEGLAALRG